MSVVAEPWNGGFSPPNYVANKYKNNAKEFSSMISNVNSSLDEALGELNNVESTLSVSKNNTNDLLTFNVISGNEEIKSEIKTVKADMKGLDIAVSGKAADLDEEEARLYQQYLNQLEEEKEET